MKDEKRLCGRCHHEHDYGILRYSQDNVPLYGARRCEAQFCRCNSFVEADERLENLPALKGMSDDEVRALWQDTSFLSPQTPPAIRLAVRQLDTLTGNEREKAFMGLMLSQVSDVRGALVKDESKFANLVSHTDEVVESMKGVVQLSERLTGVNQRVDDVNDRLDRIEGMLTKLTNLMMTVNASDAPDDLEERVPTERPKVPCNCSWHGLGWMSSGPVGQDHDIYCPNYMRIEDRPETAQERMSRHQIFQAASGGRLRDEAIVTDGTPVDPDKAE